jgi:hypothetical protein
VVRIRRWRRRT